MMDRLNKEGIFETEPNVVTIGLMGYSWGGGTAARLAQDLNGSEYGDIPVHMALIDAVQLGSSELAAPVIATPPAESIFNRYQTHNSPSKLEIAADLYTYFAGGNLGEKSDAVAGLYSAVAEVIDKGNPARGWEFSGMREGVDDQASLGLNEDHFTIDDKKTLDPTSTQENTIKLISKAIDHITSHL